MPDLIAQGNHRQHRWRRPLRHGEQISLGRTQEPWSVPWDEQISRQHVLMRWDGVTLHIEALPQARNAVFFQGVAIKQCRVKPGEHFVIGGTTFLLVDEQATISVAVPRPVTEQTFSHEYLRTLPFRDPNRHVEILSGLPEAIAAAKDELALVECVVRMLFEGIPVALEAAIVIAQVTAAGDTTTNVLHWDHCSSDASEAHPMRVSQRLLHEAVNSGESVVHIWSSAQDGAKFTMMEDTDWAFCTPLPGAACHGWCFYVAGKTPTTKQQDNGPRDHAQQDSAAPTDLREEMKFTEVVASTVGSFLDVRQLQRRQSTLAQFFSAPVISVLEKGDPEQALSPREVDVTVLFCDLRGFSRETERSADNLLGLLERVSGALGVLTRHILHEGGVIGDFHGDAAMGFWGWPIAQSDAAVRTVRAAIAIRQDFHAAATQIDSSLVNFRIGMGIGSGRAVAGKIGTADQVKVTAFGPSVNLASRLESLTRRLNASILLDAETAKRLRGTDLRDFARLRRLVVVRPYGMETPLEIYELLPTEDYYPVLTDLHIEYYEQALEAFVQGDWAQAWEKLHSVPAADPSKDFLTTYIASRSRTPPPGWDGVVTLDSKY